MNTQPSYHYPIMNEIIWLKPVSIQKRPKDYPSSHNLPEILLSTIVNRVKDA